jgi:predicted metal-dependent hydrolase
MMTKSEVEKAKDNLVEASLNFADALSSNRIDMDGAEETFWEGYQIAKKAFWDAVEGYQKAKRDYNE